MTDITLITVFTTCALSVAAGYRLSRDFRWEAVVFVKRILWIIGPVAFLAEAISVAAVAPMRVTPEATGKFVGGLIYSSLPAVVGVSICRVLSGSETRIKTCWDRSLSRKG